MIPPAPHIGDGGRVIAFFWPMFFPQLSSPDYDLSVNSPPSVNELRATFTPPISPLLPPKTWVGSMVLVERAAESLLCQRKCQHVGGVYLRHSLAGHKVSRGFW